MAESALDKVLRLAGGLTRSYMRTGRNGRPVQVHQYRSRQGMAQVGMDPRAMSAPVTLGTARFSQLQAGQLVTIGNQQYKVGATDVSGHGWNYTGKDKPRSGGASAIEQAAVGTPAQNPVYAALGGKPIAPDTATVTHALTSLRGNKTWYVTLPVDYALQVTG